MMARKGKSIKETHRAILDHHERSYAQRTGGLLIPTRRMRDAVLKRNMHLNEADEVDDDGAPGVDHGDTPDFDSTVSLW